MNKQDDQFLLEEFLKAHYIDLWKNPYFKERDFPILELIFTPVCNTKCEYCYYKNYGNQLNPPELCTKQNILTNLDTLLSFLKARGTIPGQIDLFTGEFFNIPYWEKILSIVGVYCPDSLIGIPTNCTFCLDEDKLKKIEKVLETNPNVRLSLSSDGKFLDNDSRPLRNGQKYTEEYYDRLFKFGAKYRFHFHPMISRIHIDQWKDNYKWYIENIAKYYKISEKEALSMIYLLEVRNPDWRIEEIHEFSEFLKWLIEYSYSFYEDPEEYVRKFIFGGSNIFRSLIPITVRGLGCSIQSTLTVRISDLVIPPCHRTAYKGLNAGKLLIEKNRPNFHIEIENPINYMMTKTFTAMNGVKCNHCPVKNLCVKYCIGVNYEVNKDLFIPVDQVCLLERIKIDSFIQGFEKIGITDYILPYLTQEGRNEYKARRNALNDI